MSSAPPQGLNQLAEAGRLESESLEAEKAQKQASADAQANKAQGAPTTPKGKVGATLTGPYTVPDDHQPDRASVIDTARLCQKIALSKSPLCERIH